MLASATTGKRGKTLVEIVSYDEPQEENNLEDEHTKENNMTMGGM